MKLPVAIIVLLSLLTSLSVCGQNDTPSAAKVFSDSTHFYKLNEKPEWGTIAEFLTFPTDSTFEIEITSKSDFGPVRHRGIVKFKGDTLTLYYCSYDEVWIEGRKSSQDVLIGSFKQVDYVCSNSGDLYPIPRLKGLKGGWKLKKGTKKNFD